MTNLVEELTRVLRKWPEEATWSLRQLAGYVHTDTEKCCRLFSTFSEKASQPSDRISRSQGVDFLDFCKDAAENAFKQVGKRHGDPQAEAKANALHDKIKQLVIEKKYDQAIQSYRFLIGEAKDSFPDPIAVALWYEETARLIFKTKGDAKEAVQLLLGATRLYHNCHLAEEIDGVLETYEDELEESQKQYMKNEIGKYN